MYTLYLGSAEQYSYEVGSTAREASQRIRHILKAERTDLFKVRAVPRDPPKKHWSDDLNAGDPIEGFDTQVRVTGLPRGAKYYRLVKTTRIAGVRREQVMQQFLIIKR